MTAIDNWKLPEAPPEDPEAERSLIATLCSTGADGLAAVFAGKLEDEDFAHPSYQAIFQAMKSLVDSRTEITPLSLKDTLSRQKHLGVIGGYPTLIEILNAEEVGKPQVLVRILKEKSKLRKLIRIGNALMRDAALENEPPEVLIEVICAQLAGMAQVQGEEGLIEVGDLTDEVIARAYEEASGTKRRGVTVGFDKLDCMTRGFQPGNLIILAARPGIGKSTLVLNWAMRAANKKRVGIFTLEMSKDEVTGKLLTDAAGMDLRKLHPGDKDASRVFTEAKRKVDALPILIDDRAQTTVRDIVGKVDREIAKRGLDLVIVDYLQLLGSPTSEGSRNQNESTRIGAISRGLKLLAKDRHIPVIVLSQLNREIEKRQNGRPQLSDLRDSGCLEQDADMVLFIHRKDTPVAAGTPPDNSAELIIAKHRNGPTGSVNLEWHGDISRYTEQTRTIVASTGSSPAQWQPSLPHLDPERESDL